jgi:hypothetical protein
VMLHPNRILDRYLQLMPDGDALRGAE